MTLLSSAVALVLPSALALALTTSVARADEASATEHFRRGRTLLAQGKPVEALKELETSYLDLPSPNTQLLIAHAHRELGDRVRAFAEYQTTRAAAAAAASARYREAEEEAARWTEKLRNELGHLIVVAPLGADATLSDGVKVALSDHGDAQQGELWHEPGTLKVRFFSGSDRTSRSVTLAAGTTETVVLSSFKSADETAVDPTSKPRPKPSTSDDTVLAPSIVTGVIALASLGVGIGFGLSAKNEFDTVNAKCPKQSGGMTKCPYPNLQAIADSGATHQTLANVLFGVAGVAAATSIVLGVALNSGSKSKPHAKTIQLGVGTAGSGFGLSARGGFE